MERTNESKQGGTLREARGETRREKLRKTRQGYKEQG